MGKKIAAFWAAWKSDEDFDFLADWLVPIVVSAITSILTVKLLLW